MGTTAVVTSRELGAATGASTPPNLSIPQTSLLDPRNEGVEHAAASSLPVVVAEHELVQILLQALGRNRVKRLRSSSLSTSGALTLRLGEREPSFLEARGLI